MEKPLSEYYNARKNKDNLKTECKSCHYEAHKIYRANGGYEKEKQNKQKKIEEDPSYGRNTRYIYRYGITIDQYNEMLVKQNGSCKLCGNKEHIRSTSKDRKPKPLAIDHCHTTGKVRGLLCHNCNVMLGQYEKWKDKFPIFEEYINGG